MKNSNILNNKIEFLELSQDIWQKLKDSDKKYVKDVWVLSRKDLKKMSFNDSQIMQIIIKLQLNGLDLNKKVYGKD